MRSLGINALQDKPEESFVDQGQPPGEALIAGVRRHTDEGILMSGDDRGIGGSKSENEREEHK